MPKASPSDAEPLASSSTIKQRLFFIVLVATMGSLAFGYDTGIISGALPFMTQPVDQGGLNLTPLTEGLVTSALIFGAAVGAFISGFVSDRFGRRITLRTLALIFVLGALGTTLAPSVPIMILMRFLLGIAVGGGSSTVPVFIAEIAGPRHRAPLVSRNELMIVAGQLTAYIVSALMSVLLHDNHLWRYMLSLATIPGLLLFIGTFFLPGSPHWLVAEGRLREAVRIMRRLRRSRKEVRKEINLMREHAKASREGPSTRELLKERWVVRLLLLGIGMGAVAQFTGVNAFMYYTPIILKTTGMGTNASLTATIGNGIVAVLAALIALKAVSKVKRRSMLIFGLTTVILMQVALGSVLIFLPKDLTQSYLALACILLFLFFMQMCVAPIYWLLMSELFPMKLRGALTGTAVACQWICNAAVAFIFPPMLSAMGNQTFYVFAAVNLASLLFVYFCLPETKDKSLEEIETMMRQRYSKSEQVSAEAESL